MAPEEEPKTDATPPEGSGPRAVPRRNRRPGRGRRGRGRGGRPKQAESESPPTRAPEAETGSPEEAEPIFELAEDSGPQSGEETPPPEPPEPTAEAPIPSGPPSENLSRPASTSSVEQAIEEVNGVVDSLRTALEEMEEVLEMLEMFERQKNADEREIDSLRRALRQVHRPRDSGHHPHR